MTRGNYHASFDEQTFEDFAEIVGRGNIKRHLEEYMVNVIATTNQDIDGINIRLVNLEIGKLTRELTKIKSKLDSKVAIKTKYEEREEEMKQSKLKEERKKIEQAQKCQNCGKIVTDPSLLQMDGKICKGCFMSLPANELRKFE